MLNKGDLLALRQCQRRLWLKHHGADLAQKNDSRARLNKLYGQMVGETARDAFGDRQVWPTDDVDAQTRVTNTVQRLQQQPDSVGIETPFLREGLFCRADAVIRTNGHYTLQQTKASTFPLKKDKVTPKEAEPHHVEDAAIQMWAAEVSGLSVSKVELNLLDNRWIFPGDGNYQGMFRTLDISAAVAKLVPEIAEWKKQAQTILAGGLPAVETGKHCENPHACPFIAHCKKLDSAPDAHPLELLPDSAGKNLAKKLRSKGYTSLIEVPADELIGAASELYKRVQQAHTQGAAILESGAASMLAAAPYPRYFLDFEGINLPVPRWKGVRPYEQIPFQWSCHVEIAAGVFVHFEFLDTSGNDPSLACIEKLLAAIDSSGSGPIYVYHATYERQVLDGLAARYPDFSEALASLVSRIVDLLPLVKDHYYDPAMRGTFGLKKVLPTIAPDLNYGNLEDVQEGVGAQITYLSIAANKDMSVQEKEELRANLLAYCAQDTWAMVEVAYFLEGRGRPILA